MKQLTILRHAKSSWDDPSLDDFERPLNTRGCAAATAVGKALKTRVLAFDAVVASPAMRARETLELFEEAFGELPAARFDHQIYMASLPTLMGVVRSLPDEARGALLVGHNPGLHALILELAAQGDARRKELLEKFPTGAAAVLNIPVDRWADAAPGSAAIADLIFPRWLEA